MMQFWTLYLIVYTEVLITKKHKKNKTGLLKPMHIIKEMSAMTLIYQLASILLRILIRAKISLQFSLWPLGVSLSLRIA